MKSIIIIEQLDGNQFTLYDNKLGSILRQFTGFEYPAVLDSIDDVAGPYGSVYITSKYGKRSISIQGDIITADPFAMRQLLQKAIRQTGVMKLLKFTTYNDLNLQCEAEVVKVTMPYTHAIHTFLIEFIAPDWRFYGQDLIEYNIQQTILRGGSSIPTAIPMSLPEPTGLSTEVISIITNEGNEVTDPIFTLTGPGDSFTIINITTGKEFTLAYPLSEGDEVVIDVRSRTVILNGLTNIYSEISGDFWSVIPGENQLRFFIDGGSSKNTNLNISFRYAYLGI